MLLFISYLSLIAVSLAKQNHETHKSPVVTVLNGSYSGIHHRDFRQDFFLGIPFAQPPIGDLRLRIPQSLNTSWTGLKNATAYGPACIGYGEDTYIGARNFTSEDCLTLNIVRPVGYEGRALPVGVWIHGGGFYEGSGLDPRYNLSYIVRQSVEIGKPFIGVSIQYRLHGWGWLFSEEVLRAGVTNLGLRDQRLALHWLRENIGAFGGDNSRVTIWGESAGSASVGLHILAYDGRDDKLFSGAIAESGPTSGFGLLNVNSSHAEELYRYITTEAGCENETDKLACLRLLPAFELNAILEQITGEDYYKIYFGPLIDNDIIARSRNAQLIDGSFVKVPYILGVNSDDGTDFPPFGINDDSDFTTFFSGFGIPDDTLSQIETLYPDSPDTDIPLSFPGRFNDTIGLQFKRSATLIGDLIFHAPKRLASQQWVKHTYSPLYSYRFNAIPNGIPDYFAVTHFQEVSFVFHNVRGVGYPDIDPPYFGPDPFANRPKSFVQLSTLMSRMWASFISDGNPNFPQQPAPYWPTYNIAAPTNFVFDANISSYLEPDTYRSDGITFLVEQYENGEGIWGTT